MSWWFGNLRDNSHRCTPGILKTPDFFGKWNISQDPPSITLCLNQSDCEVRPLPPVRPSGPVRFFRPDVGIPFCFWRSTRLLPRSENWWKKQFHWSTNKVGQRTQKQDGTQHAFSWKSWGVASCALHEIDVRSLLKHRAHWWYQGPRFTTACCVSYAYSLLVAISVNVINSIPSV